ncbi:MAG: MFS transporter [Thermoproteota archaeon]
MSNTVSAKAIKRPMFVISAYSLISQASLGISYPGIPLYLFSEGFNESLINAILTSFAIAGLLGQILWGYLSDRIFTKQTFIELGCAGNSIGYLVLSGIKNPSAFALSYTITNFFGSASFPSAMALLADSSSQKDRGRHMGVFWSAASIGWAISVAFTGWIIENLGGFYLFLLCALLNLASLLVVLTLGSQKYQSSKKLKPSYEGSNLKFLFSSLGSSFFVFLFATIIFFILDFAKNVYIPIYYSYEVKLGATLSTLLLSFTSWIEVPAAILFGVLSDRIGRIKVVLTSYLLCTLFMFINIMVGGLGLAVFAMGIYGFVWGAFSGASSALASELVVENCRGFAMGLFNSSYSFAAVIAPIFIGSTIQTFGYKASFIVMGSLMLLFSLILRVGVRQRPNVGDKTQKQGA